MATLDLRAPGADAHAISRGLAAAGDVIRASGLSIEFLQAGLSLVHAHRDGSYALPPGSWHWRAAETFEQAEAAALEVCFGASRPPAGSALLIVDRKSPASFLD